MIVRTLDEILGTERDVGGPGWRSRRLILRADRMGCSVHDTVVAEGTEQHLHYKNHLRRTIASPGRGRSSRSRPDAPFRSGPEPSTRSTGTTLTSCERLMACCA